MKRLLEAIILSATFLACLSCGNNAYNIKGIYTAPDGTEVYLIDLDKKDTLGVTSVQGNSFGFSGTVEEPIYVYVGRGKERIRFMLEEGTVTADIDERIEYGTPLVDMNNAYHKRFYGFDSKRNEERKALQARKDDMSPGEFSAEWEKINAKYIAMQADLADSVYLSNPDNLFGTIVLEDLAAKDPSRFLERYASLPDKVKAFYQVREAYESLHESERTAPGKKFTDYLVKGGNLDGTDVRLSDYVGKGKYILLDHWASWCGPCKAEMPYIKKTWEDFAGDNFDVVSIAVSDKREDSLRELESLDMPWNQILDGGSIPSEIYGITAIPHLILFAPDGTILHRGLRGEQIHSVISQLVAGR
ncbi:MAG: AhpC/TSA family protein [Bacteroidales bacterium]|nr:AhpC/TSA family protein [Bacteroidales bacterium]